MGGGILLTTMSTTQGSLTPDQLLAALARMGIKASRATLNRWVVQGLVPTPVRGSGGRAVGRYSLYPMSAIGEAAASAYLLRRGLLGRGLPPALVAQVRRTAVGEYAIDELLEKLGVDPDDRIPWSVIQEKWEPIVWGPWGYEKEEYALMPEDLRWMAGVRYRKGIEVEVLHLSGLVKMWIDIRDYVNRHGTLEGYDDPWRTEGELTLVRTPRGTYRLEVG